MRRRRDTAGKHGAGRHGLGDSGLRTDHRAIADFNMIDDAYLSSQGHVSPQTRATRNSGLRRDHRILAHRHIVGDLHQIVDFDAARNHGSSDRGAIYRSVRTDFNVVFQDDDPSLGNLDTLSAAARIPESIATDHYAGVQYHALAQPAGFAHHNIRMKDAIAAHLSIVTDKDAGKKHRARADPNAFADKGTGENSYLFGNNGARIDESSRDLLPY